jgi:UDP-2,3-diacylglucosamine pyrophosphatase LpxH
VPCRSDRTPWSEAEDAHLRAQAEQGIPVPKQHAAWPSTFPPRTLAALRMRRAQLGVVTNVNAEVGQKGVKQPAPPEETQRIEARESGDELVVTAVGQEVRTLDELVARAKIDLTRYEVDRPETSMWETTVRGQDGKIRRVQNFRIVARFRVKAGPSTAEQVEALIAGAFAQRKSLCISPAYTKKAAKTDPDTLQVVAISDPHIGKLAWAKETGHSNWDTDIALRVVREGVTHLMACGDDRHVGERAFVLLGDYFQHDGKGMTTRGTVVDYDSRIQKMLEEGAALLFDLIAESAERVPTRVYIVPGNHDFSLTWALQLLVKTEFKHHPRVSVDGGYTSTKFLQWGKCLIGLDHGDKGKTRLPASMAQRCEVEWGQTTWREILTGHLHSKAMIQTVNGVLVRTMDALCGPDAWHADEKFDTSLRSIEAFRYHKGGGCSGTDAWSPDLHRAPRKGTS